MPLFSRVNIGVRTALALVVALALVAVLVLTHVRAPHTFASAITLTQLSTDPYTNTTSQHQTEVEPDSFSYGSTIVDAFQVSRFYDGGSANIGWATSTNAGATWTHGFLPNITVYAGGPWDRVSDPAVAYDATHHVWMIASLVLQNGVGAAVLVSRSTDGGLTWSNPVTVSTASGSSFYDKDWIVCDTKTLNPHLGLHSVPGLGHCYVEWDDANLGKIDMSTSADGGLSWGAPNGPSPNVAGIGGQPIIQPNGNVVVPFYTNSNDIAAFTSNNGGASWSSVVTIAPVNAFAGNGNVRGGVLPSAEVDASGKVYLVWSDCSFEPSCEANDIVLTTSADGVTWSALQRIPIDSVGSNVDHYLAGIAVDKSTFGSSAHLGVVYYYDPVPNCTTATCQLDVGYISSTDGGSTWSAATQLAGPMNVTWLANTNQGYMVGDYFSASSSNGKVYPVFAVATAQSGGVFGEAMYTVSGGLAIVGGSRSSAGDKIRVTTHQRHVIHRITL